MYISVVRGTLVSSEPVIALDPAPLMSDSFCIMINPMVNGINGSAWQNVQQTKSMIW